MPDVALLESHGSFSDPAAGISEQFVRLQVGGGETFGVLSRPLGEARSTAWVMCHSLGMEQVDTNVTEVRVARAVAAAGYPVLRFQCQGYGDSEFVETVPSLSSHVRDTVDAVRQMRDMVTMDGIGLIGIRVGAMVAARVADAEDVSFLALLAPVMRGRSHVNELFRIGALAKIVESEGTDDVPITGFAEELATKGWMNIKGVVFTKESLEELGSADILTALRRFDRMAVVIQVSRTDAPSTSSSRLVEHLRRLGATVDFRVVTDPQAGGFGFQHLRAGESGRVGDSQIEIHPALAQATAEWVKSISQAAAHRKGGTS